MIPQINLYQHSFRPTRVWMNAITGVALVGLTVATLAGLTIYTSMQQFRMIQELQQLKGQENSMGNLLTNMKNSLPSPEKKKALEIKLEGLELQRKSKENALSLLTGKEIGSRQGFSEYFRQLALFNLDKLWLSHIQISQGGHACVLVGQTLRDDNISQFVQSLKTSEIFSRIIFRYIYMKEVKPKEGHKTKPQMRFAVATEENELKELWEADLKDEQTEHYLLPKLEKLGEAEKGILGEGMINPLKLLKQIQKW